MQLHDVKCDTRHSLKILQSIHFFCLELLVLIKRLRQFVRREMRLSLCRRPRIVDFHVEVSRNFHQELSHHSLWISAYA